MHHDNKIAFLDREDIAARLDGARDRIEGLGARGFRSPSLLRSAALYDVLEDRFEYDGATANSARWRSFPAPSESSPSREICDRKDSASR